MNEKISPPKQNPYQEKPNRYPLPPLLTLGMIGLCFLLNHFFPIGWNSQDVGGFMRSGGALLIALALAIDIWALITFRKYKANIMPHRAASCLLTQGPFAYSRNPIYLANVLLLAGLGFALGSRWFIIGAVLLFFMLDAWAIKREEQHMQANFPDQWPDYIKIVRRWL